MKWCPLPIFERGGVDIRHMSPVPRLLTPILTCEIQGDHDDQTEEEEDAQQQHDHEYHSGLLCDPWCERRRPVAVSAVPAVRPRRSSITPQGRYVTPRRRQVSLRIRWRRAWRSIHTRISGDRWCTYGRPCALWLIPLLLTSSSSGTDVVALIGHASPIVHLRRHVVVLPLVDFRINVHSRNDPRHIRVFIPRRPSLLPTESPTQAPTTQAPTSSHRIMVIRHVAMFGGPFRPPVHILQWNRVDWLAGVGIDFPGDDDLLYYPGRSSRWFVDVSSWISSSWCTVVIGSCVGVSVKGELRTCLRVIIVMTLSMLWSSIISCVRPTVIVINARTGPTLSARLRSFDSSLRRDFPRQSVVSWIFILSFAAFLITLSCIIPRECSSQDHMQFSRIRQSICSCVIHHIGCFSGRTLVGFRKRRWRRRRRRWRWWLYIIIRWRTEISSVDIRSAILITLFKIVPLRERKIHICWKVWITSSVIFIHVGSWIIRICYTPLLLLVCYLNNSRSFMSE